jgi:hypothetical protein
MLALPRAVCGKVSDFFNPKKRGGTFMSPQKENHAKCALALNSARWDSLTFHKYVLGPHQANKNEHNIEGRLQKNSENTLGGVIYAPHPRFLFIKNTPR